MFTLSGVRKGSKIMWLVSMSTGDCFFPMAHRFHAEFTSPQKDGTAERERERDRETERHREIEAGREGIQG